MTAWISTLALILCLGLVCACLVRRHQSLEDGVSTTSAATDGVATDEMPVSGAHAQLDDSVAFAAVTAPPAVIHSLPIFFVSPMPRERLKYLSPFVVGGWDSHKSRHVAAWLRQMGIPDDPWALVLRAPDEALPSLLETYRDLPGWTLFVNSHPPLDTAERVYLVESVRHVPDEGAVAPSLAEIAVLAELGSVIVVADPDGMVPDYLAAARDLANYTLGTACWSHVVALAGFPLGGDGHTGQVFDQ